jgi:hypothetical protein
MLPDMSTTMTNFFASVARPRIENSTPATSASGSGCSITSSTGSGATTGSSASWVRMSAVCRRRRDRAASMPRFASSRSWTSLSELLWSASMSSIMPAANRRRSWISWVRENASSLPALR